MSLPEPPVDIVSMEVKVRLDTTVTLFDSLGNATDWVKPGVEASAKFNGSPTTETLQHTVRYLRSKVVEPSLDEVLQAVAQRTRAIRPRG